MKKGPQRTKYVFDFNFKKSLNKYYRFGFLCISGYGGALRSGFKKDQKEFESYKKSMGWAA